MRGLAAIAVVIYHAHALGALTDLGHAYLAVDLFFCLSGVVIARAYGARLDAGIGAAAFMRLRLVRLYPLYAAGTLIGIGLALAGAIHGHFRGVAPGAFVSAVAAAGLMLPAPLAIEAHARLTPFNVAAWSLLFELAANLVLVLVWSRLTRARLMLAIAAAGLVMAIGIVVHGNADLGANWPDMPVAAARTLFSFLLGLAIERGMVPLCLPRHAVLPLLALLLAVPRGWGSPGVDLFAIGVALPLFVATGVADASAHVPGAGLLGELSWPVYIFHSPLLACAAVLRGPADRWSSATGLAIDAATLGAIILCGWIGARWIDPPLRRWCDRVVPRATVAA